MLTADELAGEAFGAELSSRVEVDRDPSADRPGQGHVRAFARGRIATSSVSSVTEARRRQAP